MNRTLIALVTLALAASCAKQEETQTTDTTTVVTDPILRDQSDVRSDTGSANTADSLGTPPAADPALVTEGRHIFMDRSFGKIPVACVDCHDNGKDPAGPLLKPGYTVAGVTARPSTWGGLVKGDVLVARAYGADICAYAYQSHGSSETRSLSESEQKALNAYLSSLSSAPRAVRAAIDLKLPVRPTPGSHDINEEAAHKLSKPILRLPGDAMRGRELFDKACGLCHDLNAKKLAPPISSVSDDLGRVAASVRLGYGSMPLFTRGKLSDQQLADILAYIAEQVLE